MIYLIIGHRGTGKSNLLERLKAYQPDIVCIDLDRHIEKKYNIKISSFFQDQGEEKFRCLEKEAFDDLLVSYQGKDQEKLFISLGAGFQFDIPEHCLTLFVSRSTDAQGRSFFNRPRLNSELSPIQEYLQRYPSREERFRRLADYCYLMPEGIERGDLETEKKILFQEVDQHWGDITLLPESFRSEANLLRLKAMNFRHYEIRDDLLDDQQITKALSLFEPSKLIFSFRDIEKYQKSKFYSQSVKWVDWALELGDVPHGLRVDILSLHQRKESIEETINFLEDSASREVKILKMATEVDNFDELEDLESWRKKNPPRNCLLPRSSQGRWAWFRLLVNSENPLNFIREADGSALDQPSLYESLSYQRDWKEWGAVLGSPVIHSRSPTEHFSYSRERKTNFLRVDIQETELTAKLLSFLKEMGLVYAAVTSPLKQVAFSLCTETSDLAKELQSVNTLFVKGACVRGENTDLEGFRKMQSRDMEALPVAIWGGGGTLEMIRKFFPEAPCFSARTGDLKLGKLKEGIRILIWASGEKGKKPPETWPLEKIVDLSYSENSLGRELAVERGISYQSGLEMFLAQALKQREYWDGCK